MTLQQLQQQAVGTWVSIAPEVRPSIVKNADGTLKPFYLQRKFTYVPNGEFELEIINFADAYGTYPVVKMLIKGTTKWPGAHLIADGAQKIDFTADIAYEVTPLAQPFTDLLNKIATNGYTPWETGISQSILKRAFAPFGLAEGQVFKEYDLIYTYNNMMFWGARHVDGRGFDTEEDRPANLQIPMVKVV